MINQSLNELKLIAKSRSIKNYENKSEHFNKNSRRTKAKNKPFKKENKRDQKRF